MRRARAAIVTVLLGALTSYVFAALGAPLLEDSGIFGRAESPRARTYMVGLLENEPDLLTALSPRGGIAARAMQHLDSAESQGQWRPVSLTYLGGRSAGGMNVQVYAIEISSTRGREQFVPFALTLIGGKVVRRE